MNAFLRVVLIATAAFIVVQALPLAWFNFVLCWVVVVAAAYQYPHMILAKVQMMSSSVGFAVGMGAAIGAIVNSLGMCGALVLHFAFFGSLVTAAQAHPHDPNLDPRTIPTTFTVVADFFQIAGAPFVGALLGAFGGLVGGSTIPRPIRVG